MGNRTKRPPGRPKPQSSRPSTFFIVALGVGLLLLMFAVIRSLGPKSPTTTTTSTAATTQ